MNLYVNCCPREKSRTDELARVLLKHFDSYEEVYLPELGLKPMDRDRLAQRTEMIANGDYSDPMFDLAHRFASAENIILAAPYWDLSFPAELKIFVENIYVTGIVSKYGPDGRPVGLCKAHDLYYVTTSGGPYDPRFSYDYFREMAVNYFGIQNTHLVKAEMLDVQGYDAAGIMEEAKKKLNGRF